MGVITQSICRQNFLEMGVGGITTLNGCFEIDRSNVVADLDPPLIDGVLEVEAVVGIQAFTLTYRLQ